ncbi:hypothetical protein KI387_025578, partial [Taxus chinensis]
GEMSGIDASKDKEDSSMGKEEGKVDSSMGREVDEIGSSVGGGACNNFLNRWDWRKLSGRSL